jgi:tetratricopeptide (TPR) repeat protein
MRPSPRARLAAIALSGASFAPAIAAPSAAPPRPVATEYARAFDRGDYPRAVTLARRRIAAAPADVGAQILLARAEAALGRFEAAYQGLRKVLARDARNTDALYYVTILGGVLAQAEYDRLLSVAPDSPRAHQLLGDLYQAQERPSDAETEYKAGLAKGPASLDLLIALGDLTRHQARFEESVGYYERARKVSPRHYDVLYGLGVAHSYQRQYGAAIASFREALLLDPSAAPTRLALGHALLQSGQAAAAVSELERAAALEPRMLQAHYLLGRALTALGRSQEAAAVFEKVKALGQGQGLDAEAAQQSADPLGQTRQPIPLPSPSRP